MFIEISDETSDLTIIPAEINWDFLARLRQGYKMSFGATWEMKAEYLSNSIKLKDCQTVKKEFSMYYDPSKVVEGSGDSDDDFEDDEEEEQNQADGAKTSAVAGLVCSLLHSEPVK